MRGSASLSVKVSIVALVAVLLLGILKGVLFAAIASLLMLLAGAARPHVAFLSRIPGTRCYSDLGRHPDNEAVPGVVIFRTESSLLYFNVEHVRQVVWDKLQATPGPATRLEQGHWRHLSGMVAIPCGADLRSRGA